MGRSRYPTRNERGSGSMLMIAMLVVVLSLAWAAAVIAGYLVAVHRARSIADLAALSGAAAVRQGGEGCPAVRRIVERQGATARCAQVGDAIDFVVTVTAQVRVPVLFPGLPSEVSGTGHAGPTATGATSVGRSAGDSGAPDTILPKTSVPSPR